MSTQETLIVSELGKPVIKITQSIPTPKANELLLKITSAGLNPHDQKVRDGGLFGKVPVVLANDASGIVTALGPDVKGYSIGDRVVSQLGVARDLDSGGLQQYTLAGADFSSVIPSSISDDEATTLPSNLVAAFIALFHSTGLGIPVPFHDNPEAKTFDYAAQTLVILGGGSNCGKFGIQLAALAGIGKIIVVASPSNNEELKKYGATHLIDRHLSNGEIKSQIQAIAGDEVVYVYDPINNDHTLAVSLLSSTKKGKVATLLRGNVDESKIGLKTQGYQKDHVFGSTQLHHEIGKQFWKELGGWLETKKITPLGFKVVEEGLSVEGVNKVLDDYRDGKNPGKWHVHPNA